MSDIKKPVEELSSIEFRVLLELYGKGWSSGKGLCETRQLEELHRWGYLDRRQEVATGWGHLFRLTDLTEESLYQMATGFGLMEFAQGRSLREM